MAATECGLRFAGVVSAATAVSGGAEFEKDAFERTEAGERGLEKVEADEPRQEHPARVHPMSEGQTSEDEHAGDRVEDAS